MGTTESNTLSLLTPEQIDLLTSVLDRIVPADGGLPGAGQLGVAAYVDATVARSPGLKKLFAGGLAELSIRAESVGPSGFAALADDRKDVMLSELEAAAPEFFEALVRHTYNGYYMDPEVIALLGLEVRPPQPKGYMVEPGDLSGLERVKRRGQVHREV